MTALLDGMLVSALVAVGVKVPVDFLGGSVDAEVGGDFLGGAEVPVDLLKFEAISSSDSVMGMVDG